MSRDINGSFYFVVPNISTLSVSHRHSKTNYIGNIPWRISVKQETVHDVKQLGVYLWCNPTNDSQLWKVEGSQTLTIITLNGEAAEIKNSSQFSYHSKEKESGWTSFMKWDDLMDPKKYYVHMGNDSIAIVASIIITKVVGIQSFGFNFLKPSSLTDVILQVDRCPLHVNKSYLSMMSPVLKTMFAGHQNLEIKDVNDFEFRVFLDAIYQIPSTINESNVEFLLKLAKRFEAAQVTYQCEQFILSSADIPLTPKFLLADKYCLATLHYSCMKLLDVENIEELKNNKRYKKLTAESKDVLLETTLKMLKATKLT